MKTDKKRMSVTLFDMAPFWFILPFGIPVLILIVVIGLIALSIRMARKAAKERRVDEASEVEKPDPDAPADDRRDQ